MKKKNSVKWIIPWILIGVIVGVVIVVGFTVGPVVVEKVSDSSFSLKNLPVIGSLVEKDKETEEVETEAETVRVTEAETVKVTETEKVTEAIVSAIAEVKPEPEPEPEPETVEYKVEVKPLSQAALDYTKQINIVSADASSELVQYDRSVSNKPILAFDGDKNTSWQENAGGAGVGEYVIGYFSGSEKVKYISFRLGNWKNDEYFYGNYRPTKLGLELGTEHFSVQFPSDWGEYVVEITPACPTSSIKTIIEDVTSTRYTWQDTPISDILVFRE